MQGKPEAIARGLACGVFAGFFPLFGLQLIIGILLAVLLRGNKIAATAGTWISNPVTYVPLFFLNFKVGQWLLGGENIFISSSLDSLDSFFALGPKLIITFLVGCFIVGTIAAIISYVISLYLLKRLRQRKRASSKQRPKLATSLSDKKVS